MLRSIKWWWDFLCCCCSLILICLIYREILAAGVAIVAIHGNTLKMNSNAPIAVPVDGRTTINADVSTWKCSTCDGTRYWPSSLYVSLAVVSCSPSPSSPFSLDTVKRPSSRFLSEIFFLKIH